MKNCRNTIRTLNIGVFSLACVYRHLVIQKSKGLQHAEKTSYGNSSGTRRRKARARDRNSWQARETSCLPRVGSVLRIDTASRRFVFRGDCLEPCGSWLFGCLLAGPVRRGVDVLVWRDRVDSFSAVGKLCFAGLDVCPFWWVHKGPRRAPERVAKQKKKRDEFSTRATSIECASSHRMWCKLWRDRKQHRHWNIKTEHREKSKAKKSSLFPMECAAFLVSVSVTSRLGNRTTSQHESQGTTRRDTWTLMDQCRSTRSSLTKRYRSQTLHDLWVGVCRRQFRCVVRPLPLKKAPTWLIGGRDPRPNHTARLH